jgi:hypothetical protein
MKRKIVFLSMLLLLGWGCSKPPAQTYIGRLEYTPGKKYVAILHLDLEDMPIHPKAVRREMDVFNLDREVVEIKGRAQYIPAESRDEMGNFWITSIESMRSLQQNDRDF